MKHLQTFSLLLFLLICVSACKKDGSPTPKPSIENLEVKSGKTGDLVKIKGTGFSTNASDNIVKFNGKQAEVVEASTTLLKTKVPQNVTTGPITVAVANSEVATVGNFVVTTRSLYIFHDSEKKLAKLNIETGELAYLGSNIEYGLNSRGAVFHNANNEYVGFDNNFNAPYLMRIKLTDGTQTKVVIDNNALTNGKDFSDLTIDNNDNLLIFHDSEKKLAKINVSTGAITHIGSNIEYGKNTRGAVYHPVNNEYIGFENSFDIPYLMRIKLSDGSITKVPIVASFLTDGIDFSDFTIDSLNNVYILHDSVKKLAKIDIQTGNLTYIGSTNTYGKNTRGASFHAQFNEYIGFDYENDLPYIMRVKLSDGTYAKTSIQSSFLVNGKDFSDFVIARDK